MAAATPLSKEEVNRVLLRLGPLTADRSVVLVGGQAIAYWTRILGVSDRMPTVAQLTSKDIDFEGSARAARHAASLLGGSVRIAGIDDATPNTGVVRFVDSDGVEREIDFIDAPLGLRARDVRNTAIRLLITDASGSNEVPVWILHPERCMESRVYNVQLLGQDAQNAMRQLDASIVCAREWSRSLLGDEAVPERDRVRAVLRLNERVFRRCIGDLHFRALHHDRGVDPFDAVLADDDRLPSALDRGTFEPSSRLET
jgi:hypothetical protein